MDWRNTPLSQPNTDDWGLPCPFLRASSVCTLQNRGLANYSVIGCNIMPAQLILFLMRIKVDSQKEDDVQFTKTSAKHVSVERSRFALVDNRKLSWTANFSIDLNNFLFRVDYSRLSPALSLQLSDKKKIRNQIKEILRPVHKTENCVRTVKKRVQTSHFARVKRRAVRIRVFRGLGVINVKVQARIYTILFIIWQACVLFFSHSWRLTWILKN